MCETKYEDLWNQILKEAVELSINEPKLERKKRRNRKYNENFRTEHTFQDPKEYYRRVFYEILDQVIVSLKDRFDNDTVNFLNMCEHFVTGKEKDKDVNKIVNFFNGEVKDNDAFDLNKLRLHRYFF